MNSKFLTLKSCLSVLFNTIILLTLLLCSVSAVEENVRRDLVFVSADSVSTTATGDESSPVHSLSEALKRVLPGGIIVVQPGIYLGSENIKLILTMSVTITNSYIYSSPCPTESSTDWAAWRVRARMAAETTLLDGGGAADIVHKVTHDGVIFKGLTFLNGKGLHAGGVVLHSHATPLFEDCIFKNNVGDDAGAVYISHWSHPTFRRCKFEGNVALGHRDVSGDRHGTTRGSSVYAYEWSEVTMDDCVFADVSGGSVRVDFFSRSDISDGFLHGSGSLISAGANSEIILKNFTINDKLIRSCRIGSDSDADICDAKVSMEEL